jgi:hypothetical protein
VLPTLLFILWAYGMYALFTVILQRKGGHSRGRNRWPRVVWLILAGTVGAGLVLMIWLSFSPDQKHQNLKLTGFLGTVYAEGWPNKVDGRLEYPPTKAQQNPVPGDQPIYTLLHPETPASQMEPEKKAPKPRPVRKGKVTKSAATAKSKASAPVTKKDKVAAKGKTKKKKKHSVAPAGKKIAAG